MIQRFKLPHAFHEKRPARLVFVALLAASLFVGLDFTFHFSVIGRICFSFAFFAAGMALGYLGANSRVASDLELERFRSLISELPVGILLLSKDHDILFSNPLGQTLLQVDQPTSGRVAILQATQQAIPVRMQFLQNGREVHYSLQAHTVSWSFAKWIVVAKEVTAVYESLHAREELLGLLAHEVKTPLTSILMAVRLIHRGLTELPNPVHRALVQACVVDLDRFRILLDELLSISQSDPLAHALELRRVELGSLLRHSVQSYRKAALEQGVELRFERLNGPSALASKHFVFLDSTKITWALTHLIAYAVQRTPAGGIVELSLEQVDAGMLFRLSSAGASTQPIGVIVGLEIAREIVAAHGGELWVENSELRFSVPDKTLSKKALRNVV